MTILEAHKLCIRHRHLIAPDTPCACFYCRKRFSGDKIEEWIDEEQTALCPHCGIDSVLPLSAISDPTDDFISEMHNYWFQ